MGRRGEKCLFYRVESSVLSGWFLLVALLGLGVGCLFEGGVEKQSAFLSSAPSA